LQKFVTKLTDQLSNISISDAELETFTEKELDNGIKSDTSQLIKKIKKMISSNQLALTSDNDEYIAGYIEMATDNLCNRETNQKMNFDIDEDDQVHSNQTQFCLLI